MILKGVDLNWEEFTILGKTFCCRHLKPSAYTTELQTGKVTLHITYGNHCFTDEKENGPMLFGEGRYARYWCQERYDHSLELPNILMTALATNAYCVPHYSGDNEQYHYIEAGDYAIFFNLNKPQGTVDQLKLKVVSAYPIAEWGRASIPKGKAYKINYIIQERVGGRSILEKRKRRAQKKR